MKVSGLFYNTYEMISSNSLSIALYNGASSVVSSVSSNPITTFGLIWINLGAMNLGEAASQGTRDYVQLNNVVPESARVFFRKLGLRLYNVNDKVANLVSRALRIDNSFIQAAIIGPILEELEFRFPLLLASWATDNLASEFFSSTLLEGVIDVTGAEVTTAALAIFLSIAFTYAHEYTLSPPRAAGLFTTGLVLSYLTLAGGLGNAMIAHIVHNLIATRLGLEIGKGILPGNSEEESISTEKIYQSII